MGSQKFSFNWDNYRIHLINSFNDLLSNNELIDVVLCCEGKKIGAHRLLLSACSSYFREIFKDLPSQFPVIILHGLEYGILMDILHFIYNGEVSVDIAKLKLFLQAGQNLQIHGLLEGTGILQKHQEIQQNVVEEEQQQRSTQSQAQNSENTNDVGIKRAASTLKSQQFEKKTKKDEEPILIDNIKCEPEELQNFEENFDDPLLHGDIPQPTATSEYCSSSANTLEEEEECKIEVEMSLVDIQEAVQEVDRKVRQSNFSEDALRCLVCQKMFSHPYSLHHHKAVHSGNTECPICHAVLSRKYNLKMHMKARHNL